MKKLTIILLFLIGHAVIGQSFYGRTVLIIKDAEVANGENSGTVKGSKYVKDNFVNGKIAPFTQDFPIRYNAVDDEFEVQKDENSIIILDKAGPNNTINIGSKKYVVVDGGYYIELYTTDGLKFYKKEYKKFHPKTPPKNSYDKEKPAYYDNKIKEAYYILKADKLKEFTLNTRGLKKILPEHSKQIKSFIKANKINLKDQNSLLKLFTYLGSL